MYICIYIYVYVDGYKYMSMYISMYNTNPSSLLFSLLSRHDNKTLGLASADATWSAWHVGVKYGFNPIYIYLFIYKLIYINLYTSIHLYICICVCVSLPRHDNKTLGLASADATWSAWHVGVKYAKPGKGALKGEEPELIQKSKTPGGRPFDRIRLSPHGSILVCYSNRNYKLSVYISCVCPTSCKESTAV